LPVRGRPLLGGFLGRGCGRGSLGVLLLLGLVLVADEFDQGHIGVVAGTVAELDDAGVSAVPGLETASDHVEQLLHHNGVVDIAGGEATGVNPLSRGAFALGQGDDLLGEGTEFLGLRKGGLDPLFTKKGRWRDCGAGRCGGRWCAPAFVRRLGVSWSLVLRYLV
jgi:hypothetical protein